jgi:hypothetical protein
LFVLSQQQVDQFIFGKLFKLVSLHSLLIVPTFLHSEEG